MKKIPILMVLILSLASGVSAQDTISQWAVGAAATSEYGTDAWSATQATGEPDTDDCGDFGTAWASESSTGEDSIALAYAQAVIPTQVNIYQTYNPGSITRVELANSQTETVYTLNKSNDKPGKTPCPGVFTLNITGVDEPMDTVIIYLDQGAIGSWNEIDAVELVGISVDAPTTTNTDTQASGAAAGISVECPEGFSFDNGAEIIVNMRSGFSYTATAIGLNGFDPIIAVTDSETTLCNDDDGNAAGYEAELPTTGEVTASSLSAQMPFSYNGGDTFGDIKIIVGSVDNTPGEFVLLVEGLAVTSADGSGDGSGDPFSIHLTPNLHASGVPVTAYMISVTDGLDSFLYVVNDDNESVVLDDGTFLACDDSGTQNCWGDSSRLGGSFVSRQNGRNLPGGDFDSMMTLPWDGLGFQPGDEGYITWRMTSSSQATYGDYVAAFHIGTANEFGG